MLMRLYIPDPPYQIRNGVMMIDRQCNAEYWLDHHCCIGKSLLEHQGFDTKKKLGLWSAEKHHS